MVLTHNTERSWGLQRRRRKNWWGGGEENSRAEEPNPRARPSVLAEQTGSAQNHPTLTPQVAFPPQHSPQPGSPLRGLRASLFGLTGCVWSRNVFSSLRRPLGAANQSERKMCPPMFAMQTILNQKDAKRPHATHWTPH